MTHSCGTLLVLDLLKRFDEHRGVLSTRYPILALDNKEGNTLDAVLRRLSLVGINRRQELARGEGAEGILTIETDLGGEVSEALNPADVATLDEERPKQALLHVDLTTVCLGVVQ